MMKRIALALVGLALLWLAEPAQAQTIVVASCPSATSIGPAGSTGRPYAIDVNGNVCSGGSSGGGDASAANQVLQITQETAFNTNLGAPGSAACATDTGSCNGNSLLQRLAQRLTTINTTLGTPMQQTGGTIGLVAGSAIVGNFRIDQTTPGTTNGVVVNSSALPSGAATAANQATMITAMGSPMQQTGGTVGLVAGEAHVGEVGGNLLPITNDLTTSNATIATGQSIGGLQTLTSAVRISGSLGASGTSGLIQSVLVSFKDAVAGTSIDIYFFNANPTGSTCTNTSAFALADADRDKVIGVVHMTDFTASNTAVVGQSQNQAMPFGVASATSIYACVVARAPFIITSTANASLITRVLRN